MAYGFMKLVVRAQKQVAPTKNLSSPDASYIGIIFVARSVLLAYSV